MWAKVKSVFVPSTFTLSNGKVVKEKFNPTVYILILFVLLVYASAVFTGFSFTTLITKGKNFTDMLVKMFPPNFSYFSSFWKPMVDTLTMSLIGTLFGGILALPVAFINASNIVKNKWVITIMRTLLSLLRTIPVLVYALILVYIFGVGTFAGTVSIAIFTFSIATKMLYEQIETVDMGPYEALESSGANTFTSVRHAIFPQIKAYYYSMILYNFEMNVRSAAILGYVGAGGIGLLLNEKLGWRSYPEVGMMLLVLILVVIIIESISREIRKRIG